MTQHAETRIKERFEQLGFKPKVIKESLSRIDELAQKHPKENIGFLLRKFDRPMVTDFSNGDELWLILRDGRPITCFLRRSTQTRNRNRSLEQQLQVDYTIKLNCLDDGGWKEPEPVEPLRFVASENIFSRNWVEEFHQEVREAMRNRTQVPTITDVQEIMDLVAGRNYSVISEGELRVIRHDQEIVCRMRNGNYVVVTNEPPQPAVEIDSHPSFAGIYSYCNTVNEDNTER